MTFINSYGDNVRAEAYARLEFPNTYYLAYRDLPAIIARYVEGKNAVDFGCGTGRSARFLRRLGFHVVGIDVSEEMLRKARELDPEGDYRLIDDGEFRSLPQNQFDLVLSAFTFDNIPSAEHRLKLTKGIHGLLRQGGVAILVDSTPELYANEWASFSTKDFPANRRAQSGEKVHTVITDTDDHRPVEDIIWFDDDYRAMFRQAGLQLVLSAKPLGKQDEPYRWVNETALAPWIVYVVRR